MTWSASQPPGPLTGPVISSVCRLDRYAAWRLLIAFETPNRCILLLVAEHTRSENPYRLLYSVLGILNSSASSARPSLLPSPLQRQHAPRSLRLIAAAAQPNPLIERLLKLVCALRAAYRAPNLPSLRPEIRSGATAPSAMRQAMVSALHSETGGLRSHPGHGAASLTSPTSVPAASGEPLRHAEPEAIILSARRHGQAAATTTAEVAADEPVILVYACTDLYMTAMGRAVFGGQIARCPLGLADVTSVLSLWHRQRRASGIDRAAASRRPVHGVTVSSRTGHCQTAKAEHGNRTALGCHREAAGT